MVLKAACMGPLLHQQTNMYWPYKAALIFMLFTVAHYGSVGYLAGNNPVSRETYLTKL